MAASAHTELTLALGLYEAPDDLPEALQALARGEYASALEQLLAACGLALPDPEAAPLSFAGVVDEVAGALAESNESPVMTLAAGVAALSVFVQANWTGPDLSAADVATVEKCLPVAAKHARGVLSLAGEDMFRQTEVPIALLFARACFHALSKSSLLWSTPLWNARAAMMHAMTLSGPIEDLMATVTEGLQGLLEPGAVPVEHSQLRPRIMLELGNCYHFHGNGELAKQYFHKAKDALGLTVELTGVLGRKLKHQAFDVSQLVLKTSSTNDADADADAESAKTDGAEKAPIEVQGDSEDLLKRPKLKEDVNEKQKKLRVIEQAVILALCLDVKNQNPRHGLTTEEMMPYVMRIMDQPENWMVFTYCLLLKARLESERYKTVERSVLQMQAIVDQHNDTDAKVAVRMQYIYEIHFPPRWAIKRELGERYLSIGVAASALQIFEPLEMWEQMVQCHVVMDKPNRATDLVESCLTRERTPLLLTMFGELTDNVSYFEEAWNLSNKRFARAKRSWGQSLVRAQKHVEAIPHFTDALSINSMYPMTWFNLGCCHLRAEDYHKAALAFSRVVQLEPEDAEGWSNLASCYIREKELKKAFTALGEALKHRRESWKMWQNYLYVALDIGEYSHAILAFSHLLDIDATKKKVDTELLDGLVRAALKEDDKSLLGQVATLLGKVTSRVTNNEHVWKVYADYEHGVGHLDRQRDCLLKRVRALQATDWMSDRKKFNNLADGFVELGTAGIDQGASSKDLYAWRLLVQSTVKRALDNFGDTPQYGRLEQLRADLVAAEKAAKAEGR